MDKKSIEKNIQTLSQVNNSILRWAHDVSDKWTMILTEAKKGALRELHDTFNAIASSYKEEIVYIPFGEMWELALHVGYSWKCDNSKEAIVEGINLIKNKSGVPSIEVIVQNCNDNNIKETMNINYFKDDDVISILTNVLEYLYFIVFETYRYRRSVE